MADEDDRDPADLDDEALLDRLRPLVEEPPADVVDAAKALGERLTS
jgi:hypothetical protein